ncbi:MAG: SDR family NAD(P)-dependent oxidoreductase [Candidatus Binatia bacterium]
MKRIDLTGAVAVVTGASRGIGRAAALAFARAGAHVVCTARSTAAAPSKIPGTIDDVAEQVRALGRGALAVCCDIREEEQVEALARSTMERFGRIDILVNNAAVNFRAPFAETPMKRWDLVLDVNLRGSVLCTKAVLPHMRTRGSGSIVNVSSGAVNPELASGIVPYAVSKAGLEMLTRALALELRPRRIAVNGLRIESSVASEGAVFFNPQAVSSDWDTPEAVGEDIFWLATREPTFTGQVLTMAEVRAARAKSA